MKRLTPIALLGLALLTTACGSAQDAEKADAQDVAALGAGEGTSAEPAPSDPAKEEPLIPAKFQGNWGEAEDHLNCAPDGSNVMRVTANTIVYPTGTTQISEASPIDADAIAITGRYGETGQEPSKDVNQQLKLSNGGDTLSEIFDGMAPFDYIRC
ncbi:hypothetical protein [Citromicrobium bathyomarinum]|uniref:hypothetical protein n=1 Tax=Citromicrobium bathyomarinum TaxID=72174 RepID=UPI00315AE4EC